MTEGIRVCSRNSLALGEARGAWAGRAARDEEGARTARKPLLGVGGCGGWEGKGPTQVNESGGGVGTRKGGRTENQTPKTRA